MKLQEELLVQMRIAHLGMIQSIIARMAGFSANAKTFCITILTALVAVAFQKAVPSLVWAGVAVSLVFALLDAYYLALERRFKKFYAIVSTSQLAKARKLAIEPDVLKWIDVALALASPSIAGFYIPLLVGTYLLLDAAGRLPSLK